jgi:hypothetical protein
VIGNLEKVILEMNKMVDRNILSGFAIGGSVAVQFYTEPFFTDDIDFFVVLKYKTGIIISLEPVFEFMRKQGHRMDSKGYFWIHGMKVQLIPVSDGLDGEAYEESKDILVGSTPVKSFSAEYLLAIMLEIERTKDLLKMTMILDQAKELDENKFADILRRYDLVSAWKDYELRRKPRKSAGSKARISTEALKVKTEARIQGASLPIEEKIRRIAVLQRLANEIRRSTGRPEYTEWDIE